jgi:hypothetical protein
MDSVFDQNTLNRVAQSLGLASCSPDLERLIREIAKRYLDQKRHPAPTYRRADVVRRLNHIAAGTQDPRRLTQALMMDELDPVGEEALFLLFITSQSTSRDADIFECLEPTPDLPERATRAAGLAANRRGGRPPDIEFHVLLAWLKALFETATRRAASVTWDDINGCYKGQFFTFVSLIESRLATELGEPARSNRALGETLREITGSRLRRKQARSEAS